MRSRPQILRGLTVSHNILKPVNDRAIPMLEHTEGYQSDAAVQTKIMTAPQVLNMKLEHF